MNHLAHALLADAGGTEFALGSAMGDFAHGRPDPAWPAARQAGLRFHRAIDRYTDAHPQVVAARRLFRPPLRRFAGIALDIWLDHLLVLGWARLVPGEPLERFTQRWLSLLDAHAAELPEPMRGLVAWMRTHRLPAAYGDEVTLDLVFHALAKRLSRPSPLGDALPALLGHSVALQGHFDAFFPQLVAHADGLRRGSPG